MKPGLFYAGYAAILTPSFGVRDAYGDDVAQYNNALGFFMLCKCAPDLRLAMVRGG